KGFKSIEQSVTVISGNAPVLHFFMTIAPMSQRVEVIVNSETSRTDSPTPTTLIRRQEISQTPGSDRTNSLAFITNFVPGSYLTHNQLHVRGGHQVTWLIDGVPVPNTNIADTVGAQFDPKDIDYLEIQRGRDRKSTRLNSSHVKISYAVFCLKKEMRDTRPPSQALPPFN